MIAEALTTLVQIVKQIRHSGQQPVPLKYPDDHPLAGQAAGFLVQNTDGEGGEAWVWQPTPRGDVAYHVAHADIVKEHKFKDAGGLVAWLGSAALSFNVFVETLVSKPAQLRALVESSPEGGTVEATVLRSPAYSRWYQSLADAFCGRVSVLSQDVFSDLLLTNITDLEDQLIAKMVATMQTAKTVSYAQDEDGNTNVKVEWKQARNGADGSKMVVPPTFTLNLPPYSAGGVWEPGKAPVEQANFRVRLLPPTKADSAEPRYQVMMTNADDYELRASDHLHTGLKKLLGERVFLGVPAVKSFYPVP